MEPYTHREELTDVENLWNTTIHELNKKVEVLQNRYGETIREWYNASTQFKESHPDFLVDLLEKQGAGWVEVSHRGCLVELDMMFPSLYPPTNFEVSIQRWQKENEDVIRKQNHNDKRWGMQVYEPKEWDNVHRRQLREMERSWLLRKKEDEEDRRRGVEEARRIEEERRRRQEEEERRRQEEERRRQEVEERRRL